MRKSGEDVGPMNKTPEMDGSIVYVRYLDHVLFRNVDGSSLLPMIREAVGWVERESEEALWLVFDRPREGVDKASCGLVLLRKMILDMKKIQE